MRKNLFFLLLMLGMLISACKHPTVFKEVQAPGLFTMQIPTYMRATDDLLPAGVKACLEYANDTLEVYMFVIDTTRKKITENTLKSFYDSIVATNPEAIGAKMTQPKFALINGDSSLSTEMTLLRGDTNSKGTKIFYRIQVMATPNRFYYLQLWTKEDKKEELKDDFNKIMGSFTDINHIKE